MKNSPQLSVQSLWPGCRSGDGAAAPLNHSSATRRASRSHLPRASLENPLFLTRQHATSGTKKSPFPPHTHTRRLGRGGGGQPPAYRAAPLHLSRLFFRPTRANSIYLYSRKQFPRKNRGTHANGEKQNSAYLRLYRVAQSGNPLNPDPPANLLPQKIAEPSSAPSALAAESPDAAPPPSLSRDEHLPHPLVEY